MPSGFAKSQYDIARAIEAAILAKLGAMELPEPLSLGSSFAANVFLDVYLPVHLQQAYAQGAAAQLAHEPIGWFVKEHGDVVDLEWNSEKPKYEGDWKPLYTRREAK